jgi:hypothetical protein
MLLRRVAAVDDGAGAGAGLRPRLFGGPRLAPGRCAPPDCDSPTSPLDLWAFPALGGALVRSPRSWDSRRVGLGGIVDDALAEPAAGAARTRLHGPQMRPTPFKLPQRLAESRASESEPRDCAHPPPLLRKVEATAAVTCSRSYGDLKSGPEPIVPGAAQLGASNRSPGLGKFPAPGSLPASIGGLRRYVGSVSATEVEQSEDYTCIIAHGPNPKTTRIFGDCILEPVTVLVPDGEGMEAAEVNEAAESYWLVKCSEEESSDSCLTCKENLDDNITCIPGYVDAIISKVLFYTNNCGGLMVVFTFGLLIKVQHVLFIEKFAYFLVFCLSFFQPLCFAYRCVH